MTRDALVDDLRKALAADRVRDGAVELGLYRGDASNMTGGARVVCFPTSTAEVQACVRLAQRHQVPFVARGSGTGLAGGAVPPTGAIVIVTTKMDKLLTVDVENRLAWVEPGMLNLDVSRAGRRPRSPLRPRPVESAELLDRRERRQQLGWAALPRRRRDDLPCPGAGGRAGRRVGVRARWRGPRTGRARSARARSSAAKACSGSPPGCASASRRTLRRCGRCCSTSTGSRTAPGPSAPSSPPGWCPPRWR